MLPPSLFDENYVAVPSDRRRACHLDWQHQIFLFLIKMGLQFLVLAWMPCFLQVVNEKFVM